MTEGEMLKLSVEEFSRIQQYMLLAEKDSTVYKSKKHENKIHRVKNYPLRIRH